MPPVVTRWSRPPLLALLLILVSGSPEIAGQATPRGDAELGALSSVLSFRLYWLEDSTPFDSCSVFLAAGEPDNFPSGIPEDLRPLVAPEPGASARACTAPAASGGSRRVVLVESATVADSTAQVRLLVRKGERSYQECYTLARNPLGRWEIVKMEIGGTLLALPRPTGVESS